MSDGPSPRWSRLFAPAALAFVLVLLYLPSLRGGFLNLDDPWLIEENPFFRPDLPNSLSVIWFELGQKTRLTLGAEYLPVRDTSFWLEARLWGLDPQVLRVTNLAIYIGACLVFRAAFRRALGGGITAEAAAWLFAVHPVHVESAAWLAGRKDVLALLFVALAIYVHAGEGKYRFIWVPLLVLLAGLSKAMAIVAIGLLLATDLLARQRPDPKVYGVTAVVCAGVALLAMRVGDLVGMTTSPLGGSRWTAAAGMGRAWLHYIEAVFNPTSLSIVHDPPDGEWGLLPVLGWALVAVWGAMAWVLFRSRNDDGDNKPLLAVAFLWFFVPLLPVTQIFLPLENFWTDRYLFLSVMGPCLLFGGFLEMMGDRRAIGGMLVLAGGLAIFTWQRAGLFADSIRVFRDAQEKTESEPLAPYQLAQAYEAAGKDPAAIKAYREVLHRQRGRGEAARRATNNLAKLLARQGKLASAERVLRRGRKLWPRDPKILANLAQVLSRRSGKEAEAQALAEQLAREHPGFRPE